MKFVTLLSIPVGEVVGSNPKQGREPCHRRQALTWDGYCRPQCNGLLLTGDLGPTKGAAREKAAGPIGRNPSLAWSLNDHTSP